MSRFIAALFPLLLAGCFQSEESCADEIKNDLDSTMDAVNNIKPIDLDLRLETKDRVTQAKIILRGIELDENRNACDYYAYGGSLRKK